MFDRFKELVTLTILRPAEAIGQIVAMQLPTRISWSVLVLGVMLSTLAIFSRALRCAGQRPRTT